MNRYPLWKYILITVIVGLSVLYALPNLYGKDPAVQISSSRGQVSDLTRFEVEGALEQAGISYESIIFCWKWIWRQRRQRQKNVTYLISEHC
jgi:preprotein translocase subunit SecD